MTDALDAAALDTLFRTARTQNGWRSDAVPEALIREIYELAKFGPTSANASPARFVWVTTPEAKARLAGLASGANAPKILAAPVTVIVGHDLDFARHLPRLFSHAPDAANWFKAPEVEATTAFRNGTLQGAYLLMAARALGLDVGPMSGFDNAGVDAAFFAGTRIRSNFIASIGRGSSENLFPRNPRLAFDEANRIV